MLRKGTEQKNAMDMVVFVYFINCCKKLILGNVSRKKDFFTCYAKCLAAFGSAFLIGNIAWILANTDNAQCRIYTLCLKLCYICFNFLVQRCCYFFSQ